MTDLEQLPQHFMSTANIFNLPLGYQYGVGLPHNLRISKNKPLSKTLSFCHEYGLVTSRKQGRSIIYAANCDVQDTIGKFDLQFDGKDFILVPKQTACLAQDACGIPPAKMPAKANSGCSPKSGCC